MKYESLVELIKPYVDVPLSELPEGLDERVKKDFSARGLNWDGLTPEWRLSLAQQHDWKHDTKFERENGYFFALSCQLQEIESQKLKWELLAPQNITEEDTKEKKLSALTAQLGALQKQIDAPYSEISNTAPKPQALPPSPVIALDTRRGNVLTLPNGQTHVQFGELAHLIADALWPDAGVDDTRMTYGCTRVNLDAELVQAVKSGVLQLKDPSTFGPHTFPVGNALLSALVAVDDLREFVTGRGLTVETAKTQPTTPSPAPMTAASASGGVEPEKAGPVDKTWVMKRAALIKKHIAQWPTINRDFQDASENGLSKAAKAPGHGEWFEAAALNWAEQLGKLEKGEKQSSNNLATVWTGKKHTNKG